MEREKIINRIAYYTFRVAKHFMKGNDYTAIYNYGKLMAYRKMLVRKLSDQEKAQLEEVFSILVINNKLSNVISLSWEKTTNAIHKQSNNLLK